MSTRYIQQWDRVAQFGNNNVVSIYEGDAYVDSAEYPLASWVRWVQEHPKAFPVGTDVYLYTENVKSKEYLFTLLLQIFPQGIEVLRGSEEITATKERIDKGLSILTSAQAT